MISGVDQVVLAVEDQERALTFWTEAVGFELVRDDRLGDERWIELRPPAGSPLIVLSQREAHEVRPEVPDHLPHSNVFFASADIQRTHRELAARGVRFAIEPRQMPWGWWAMFEDPEGTRYGVGQHEANA